MDSPSIVPLAELSLADLPRVGGKTASLGEMVRTLQPLGVRIPEGFAVTAQAYRQALDEAQAWPRLHALLDHVDKNDAAGLQQAARAAREIVLAAPMPAKVEAGLRRAWRGLLERLGPQLSVAVRSSATAEDLPTASFAGQHETVLNVRGEDALVQAVRRCQASIFTDRAIAYRIDNGFDHFRVSLSVVVMQMVRADQAASGVIFTRDTESGHPDFVLVTGAWGLGENVVQGTVDPDEFHVHKPTFRLGHHQVLRRRIGRKQWRMVYGAGPQGETVVNEATGEAEQARACLSDEQVLELAKAALHIEAHYSRLAGAWRAMDIEWAQDGPGGLLYIVQARPDTSRTPHDPLVLERFVLDTPDAEPAMCASGRAVGERIASGRVRRIDRAADLGQFHPGEVLVTDTTSPDWEPVMKTASAIVTERGGRTCHAAIVARELGIPAVVGAAGARATLPEGGAVTVSCAEGEIGRVYEGTLPFHVERVRLDEWPRPRTQVHVNLGNPQLALRTAMLPCDGVGLARMEFIISESIAMHPMAALHPERIRDPAVRDQLLARARGSADAAAFFVERLAEGVATLCAAFWPRPVVVRLSDFKSNEYASLPGGADFEPHEENPMLGLRGAARYLHPDFVEAFALECRALRRVREDMGLVNMRLMVPFCRSLGEARRVLAALAAQGLARDAAGGTAGGVPVWMMCEIPNNVLLIDEFAPLFDGISIGSNDLTQLVLGVDRDSALVASAFDECDPGVLKMLRQAIEGAHRCGRPSGICGQAPSDHPELLRLLVAWGIDSLSVTPDRLLATVRAVAQAEAEARAGVAAQSTVAPLALTTAS